jgi:hypothetical protein
LAVPYPRRRGPELFVARTPPIVAPAPAERRIEREPLVVGREHALDVGERRAGLDAQDHVGGLVGRDTRERRRNDTRRATAGAAGPKARFVPAPSVTSALPSSPAARTSATSSASLAGRVDRFRLARHQ